MTQATRYQPIVDYSELLNTTQVPGTLGAKLDTELAAIDVSLTQTQDNLELVQRDDGALRNSIVTPDSLSSGTKALIAGTWTPRGLWVTATAYVVGDVVESSGVSYVCATAHTSGTFATDHTAGKWVTLGNDAGSSTYIAGGNGAVERSVQDKERDTASVFDYASAAQKADVRAATLSVDMSDTLTDQHAALPSTGGTIVIPGQGRFLIEHEIDATTASGAFGKRVHWRNEAGGELDQPTLIAKHAGYIYDLVGSRDQRFSYSSIGTDATTFPKAAFLQARAATGGGGRHRYLNDNVYGKFSEAVLYSYGSEENEYIAPFWTNTYTGGPASVVVMTANNIRSLSSSNEAMATGAQSNISNNFFGGSYHMNSAAPKTDVFHLEGVDNAHFIGGWALCGDGATATGRSITGITQASPAVVTYSGTDLYTNGDAVVITGVVGMTEVNGRAFTVAGLDAAANTFQLSGLDSSGFGAYVSGGTIACRRSIFYVDTTNQASNNSLIDGFTGENATGLQEFFMYVGDTSRTVSGIALINSRMPSNTYAFFSHESVTVDNLIVMNCSEVSSKGFRVAGNLQKAFLQGHDRVFSIRGSMSHTIHIGDRANITVGTDDGTNIYLDTGLGQVGAAGFRFPATQISSADPNTLDDYQEASFEVTLTGCTTSPTYTVYAVKIGKMATLTFSPTADITATSNDTSKTLTGTPVDWRPGTGGRRGVCEISDNGGGFVMGAFEIVASGVITIYAGAGTTAWTNSGTATIKGGFCLTYPLD